MTFHPPLTIQDISLLDLINQYWDPLYVYDADIITRQYKKLTECFDPTINLRINYACKANTNLVVMSHLHSLWACLDTVSVNEVKLGIQAGFTPDQIIFTPNGVCFSEIREAIELWVQINIDNISQLEQFGLEYWSSVPLCLRVNPHIMAWGNYEISVGHIDSKFGISVHQMRHVLRIVERTGIKINGLHMHTGSDILDAGVFLQWTEILFQQAQHLPDLQFVDFWSGFKVPYEPGGKQTNLERLGVELSSAFKQFCTEYGRDLELWFEPGKFLVSESGYFLTKVNVIKQTPATVFACVNTWFQHLMRPKLYGAHHHITNMSNPNATKRFYTVVGYICETDTFAWDRELPEIREHDILCFHNAGAYCYSMASTYNSRGRPAEIFIKDGIATVVRRAETLEDLTRLSM